MLLIKFNYCFLTNTHLLQDLVSISKKKMDVYEARGVCQDPSSWRSIVPAYPFGKRRVHMYVCRYKKNTILFGRYKTILSLRTKKGSSKSFDKRPQGGPCSQTHQHLRTFYFAFPINWHSRSLLPLTFLHSITLPPFSHALVFPLQSRKITSYAAGKSYLG